MLSTVDADPDLESSMSVEYLIDPSNGPQWKGILPGKPQPYVLRKGEGEHAMLFTDLFTVLLSGDETDEGRARVQVRGIRVSPPLQGPLDRGAEPCGVAGGLDAPAADDVQHR